METQDSPTTPTVSGGNRLLKIGGLALAALLLLGIGVLIGLLTSGAFARRAIQDVDYAYGYAYGPGMMGRSGAGPGYDGSAPYGGVPFGPGRMGGRGMMGGRGWGMMGGYVPDPDLVPEQGERLTIDQAEQVAQAYADDYGDDLEVAEVMEFSNHFYAAIREADTGIGAFEILIDPFTAAAHPEPGPNMMWNTQYGMMRGYGPGMMGRGGMMGGYLGNPSDEMTVTPEEALDLAQTALDDALPGAEVEDEVTTFYGYYTIDFEQDGEIAGMLSVNGYTGEVWLHTWHGDFVQMIEH